MKMSRNRNRDLFTEHDPCDALKKANDAIMNRKILCIMDILIDNQCTVFDRCTKYCTNGEDCNQCIEDWMNESG